MSLAGNIVLTYLLLPGDFGLVSMLAVFTSLIYVFTDCGLSDGLLMRPNPTDRDFNTVFYFNLAVGTLICLIYAGLSGVVARFFGHPQLQAVMVAFGLGAIVSSMLIAQQAKLRSRLQFKKLALINVLATTLALCVAVGMAVAHSGYWALVELQVGYSGFYLLLLVAFSKWNLRLEFDVQRFKELWKFGVNLLFSTIITQVSQNIFTLVLGKYYNPTQAGYMGQAQKMQQTPTNSLEMAISSTSYVVIAKYETKAEKNRQILNMFNVITLALSLALLTLAALSQPLIDFVFPDTWQPVVPYFRMMLLWGLVYPVNNFMMIVFKLFNHTAVIRNIMAVEKTLIVVVAFALCRFGVLAMLGGAIALSCLSFMLYIDQASRQTGIPRLAFARRYAANLVLGLVTGAATWGATLLSSNSLVSLLIALPVAAGVALAGCRLFNPHVLEIVASRLKGRREAKTATDSQ